MATSPDGANPLRPYYIPPSIGLSPNESINTSSPAHAVSSASAKTIIGSSARDIFSDLDYGDYLESSPSVSEWMKDIVDRALWKYTSILLAQPFDVAKTILQVYVASNSHDGQTVSDELRSRQSYPDGYDDVSFSFYL